MSTKAADKTAGKGTPIELLRRIDPGPGLVTILRQRRDATLRSLESYADRFATHDDLDLASQTELEQRLDDFALYDDLFQRVAGSAVERTAQPAIYRANGHHSFFADLVHRALYHDGAATGRLSDHAGGVVRSTRDRVEVTRDIGSSAVGAMVAPQYLIDLAAPVVRPSGLLAAMRVVPMPPEGMNLLIPRVTAGPSMEAQAENASAEETNIAVSNITAAVTSVAGRQDVSRQIFDRAPASIDRFVHPDLVEEYLSRLDDFAINGAGSGEPTGILNQSGVTSVTYTDASPTALELLGKVTSAAKQASANRKLPMTAVVMHSRRWYWLCSQLDTAGSPAVPVSTTPPDPTSPYVGSIRHMGVIVDDNIPTTASTDQDRIIVCRPWDLALVADLEPTFDAYAASQVEYVTLVANGYASFTAERYASSIAVISGTGLADPGTW